jgi:hypothetical protein
VLWRSRRSRASLYGQERAFTADRLRATQLSLLTHTPLRQRDYVASDH